MYYFEVVFSHKDIGNMLVKAEDVIEAGMKASEVLSEKGYFITVELVERITRTDIKQVIE